MKKINLLLVIFYLLNLLVGDALANSLEITTGSGTKEGIVNREGEWLRDGSMVQILDAYQGMIHPPDMNKKPSGGDVVISTISVGYGFPFNKNEGKFDCQVSVDAAKTIYVRAWFTDEVYGNSGTYKVQGFVGEFWDISGSSNEPAFQTNLKVGAGL